jgi:hypothetical protein
MARIRATRAVADPRGVVYLLAPGAPTGCELVRLPSPSQLTLKLTSVPMGHFTIAKRRMA